MHSDQPRSTHRNPSCLLELHDPTGHPPWPLGLLFVDEGLCGLSRGVKEEHIHHASSRSGSLAGLLHSGNPVLEGSLDLEHRSASPQVLCKQRSHVGSRVVEGDSLGGKQAFGPEASYQQRNHSADQKALHLSHWVVSSHGLSGAYSIWCEFCGHTPLS